MPYFLTGYRLLEMTDIKKIIPDKTAKENFGVSSDELYIKNVQTVESAGKSSNKVFSYVLSGVGFGFGCILIAVGIFGLRSDDKEKRRKGVIQIIVGTMLALIGLVYTVLLVFTDRAL